MMFVRTQKGVSRKNKGLLGIGVVACIGGIYFWQTAGLAPVRNTEEGLAFAEFISYYSGRVAYVASPCRIRKLSLVNLAQEEPSEAYVAGADTVDYLLWATNWPNLLIAKRFSDRHGDYHVLVNYGSPYGRQLEILNLQNMPQGRFIEEMRRDGSTLELKIKKWYSLPENGGVLREIQSPKGNNQKKHPSGRLWFGTDGVSLTDGTRTYVIDSHGSCPVFSQDK